MSDPVSAPPESVPPPPVRVALTGTGAGLPLWEPTRLLGKQETLRRLHAARARL